MSEHCTWCPFKACMICKIVNPAIEPPPLTHIRGSQMTIQELVREMCTAFGQDVHDELHKPDQGVRGLRLLLLSEEFREYMDAEKSTNPVDIADALGDMLVVIYGTAHAYGINLDNVVREIHASNMTKVQPDGSVLRDENGKVCKPDGYRPPQLAPILGNLDAWETA